ncbi:MAG: helix-turn-helix transcriptional regulator [Ardenticatenaceae bacterium]|nr:helix-turn-helix transcriptional regulator [Ardenticatenaceae bacterium]
MPPTKKGETVANRLRQQRKKGGFTQEDLGKAANLTRQSIIAIEKGRFIPSVQTALLLARALGSSVDELFWLAD